MAQLKIQALLGNHYQTLGVSAFATTATIFYACQDLRDRNRPDGVPPDQRPAAIKRIKAINAAWHTLSDASRRAAYDEQRRVANGGRSYDNPGEDPYNELTSDFYDDPAGLPGREQSAQHRKPLRTQQLARVIPAKRKKSEADPKSHSQQENEEAAGKRQKFEADNLGSLTTQHATATVCGLGAGLVSIKDGERASAVKTRTLQEAATRYTTQAASTTAFESRAKSSTERPRPASNSSACSFPTSSDFCSPSSAAAQLEPKSGHASRPARNTSDTRAVKITGNTQHVVRDPARTAGSKHAAEPPRSRNPSPETTANAASTTSVPTRTERLDPSEPGVSIIRKCLIRILHDFNRAHTMAIELRDDAAHDALKRGHWIGLVRSLSKLMHKAKVMARGDLVTLDDFAEKQLRSYSADVAAVWLKNALDMAKARHRQVADLLVRLWAFGDVYNRLVSHGSHRRRKVVEVLAMLVEVEAYARSMTD